MQPRAPAATRCLYLLALIALGACQEAPKVPTLTPYRMDIQQGNIVTQDMLAKLKPGMTPAQVRFILGTPLVVDAFHKDRWDYVYRYSKGGRLQEARRIVIIFRDDKLARIEGDVATGAPGSATEGGVKIDKPIDKPVAAEPAQKKSPESPPPAGAASAGGASDKPVEGKAEEGKAEEDKSKAGEQPKEERGFFGRMLDRLGF